MISITETRQDDQARRLRLKTQDQRLSNLAVGGAGITPWEAQILTDMVHEVYFAEPDDRPLTSGELRYTCVAITEGAGKPIAQCRMQTVVLSLIMTSEDLPILHREGSAALRHHRLLRLAEEAREQGGLLSQEDLAVLLACDVRTVRRDIADERSAHSIIVPTRGQVKDIGPGVSHKGMAIRHWLEGQEPVSVARQIHHSLTAVERYIQHFSRVVYLARKNFTPHEIALTCGLSSAGVKTYLEIYDTYRSKQDFWKRFEEIDLIGATHYQAEDAKKGGPSPSHRPKFAREAML